MLARAASLYVSREDRKGAVVNNRNQLLHVNRLVAEGMLRVIRQERRLEELERSGYDTTTARADLAAFKQTLQQMIERRKEILLRSESRAAI